MRCKAVARQSHETSMRAQKVLVVGKVDGIHRVAHRTRLSNALHLRDGRHDILEFWLERRSAHQETIDIGASRQLGGVLGVRGAAVLDTYLFGCLLIDCLLEVRTERSVSLLGLFRASGHASANGPDWLVRNDNTRLVLEALEDGQNVNQLH